MKKLKIPCKISKNDTISREGIPENGCDIFLPDCTRYILIDIILKPLQQQYKFNHIYLTIPNQYRGFYGYIDKGMFK